LDRCSRRSRDDAFSRVRLRRNPRERRDQLFERFLPLARKLAGRYASAREPREDLVQVASIGRLGAIDRFERGPAGVDLHARHRVDEEQLLLDAQRKRPTGAEAGVSFWFMVHPCCPVPVGINEGAAGSWEG
jgi:hypothetical protein